MEAGLNLLRDGYEEYIREHLVTPRVDSLHQSLDDAVVEELQKLIHEEVVKNCEGCKIEHPSQVQHDLCLFTSPIEWTEQYIDLALVKLDVCEVMERWYPKLVEMDLRLKEKFEGYMMFDKLMDSVEKNRINYHARWVERWAVRVKTSYQNVQK